MHVHLIGVAGTAMASLARLLLELDHRVTGSDENVYPPMSTELARMGVAVRTPYAAANLEPRPDLVVVGNAIPRGNSELETCLDAGLRYTSQAEAIEDLVLPGRTPVVITGTHGKTTTTTLVAWMLTVAGREPGWFVGGVPHDLPTSSALGRGPEIVLEGDEYDTAYFDKRPKFHHYRPRILVIGNLEHDHADIYPNLEAIALEFRRLVNTVPANGLIAVNAESAAALAVVEQARCRVVRYGFGPGLDLAATGLTAEAGRTHFDVGWHGAPASRLTLGLLGSHNVQNALAAIAIAGHLGIDLGLVGKALSQFRGVKRRLELLGIPGDIEVYDDFAHHPTAIRATLLALRSRNRGGRLWAVLEPRSWSMRRNLHQATLPDALATADVAVMTPVFQIERVPAGLALDVPRVLDEVRARGGAAHLDADPAAVVARLARDARAGDTIVIMSNGGFDGIHERLLGALESKPPGPRAA